MPTPRQFQRVLSIAALNAFIVFEAEMQTDELTYIWLIFDDEDGGAR
jgi:hypothetical protein